MLTICWLTFRLQMSCLEEKMVGDYIEICHCLVGKN